MRLSDENLQGRTIIAADGQVVGEVTALFFESDSWRVESLHVKLAKAIADELGANRSVFRAGALELPVRMIQSVGDTLVLSVPVDGLREVLPAETLSDRAEAEGAPTKKGANKQAIEKAKKAKAVEKPRLEKKAPVEKARLEKTAKVVEKARLVKKTKGAKAAGKAAVM